MSSLITELNSSDDYYTKKTFNRFLIPTIVSLGGTLVAGFANTLLAGRLLGKEALSVMGILQSFTFLYSMLGCLISIGASTRAAVAMGKGDHDTAAKYEWMALVMSIIIPVAISLLCLINFKGVFTWLGGDEAAYAIGAGYGRIVIAFGFLNTLIYFPFNFLRLIGKGRFSTIAFGLMGPIDIILVYSFIRCGMGITGIAAGFVLSMAVASIISLYFLFTKNHVFKMKRPSAQDILPMSKHIVSYGSASALNNLCRMMRTAVMNILVSKYLGKDGLASLAVGFSIMNLASATVTGFGQAISPIIGVLHGERDRRTQRRTVIVGLINAAVFHIATAAILIVYAPYIAGFFGVKGSAHIADTALLIRLVAVSLIPSAVMNVLIYYYTAIGENIGSMILTAMHVLVFPVLFCAIHLASDTSVWYGLSFTLAELLDFGVMVIYSVYRTKKRDDLQGLLLEEKVYSEKFFITTSDGTEDGAVKTSGEVVAFCEENEVDPMLCMKLPLVVEELLVVLARHCATESDFRVDVRISLTSSEVIMRMRCGGMIFNPIEWFRDRKEKLSPEKFLEDESFGMNVVNKLVKDFKYSSVFEMNNLIISMAAEAGK